MTVISRKRIRLACDISNSDTLKDKITGNPPHLWRGNDVQFEIGVLYSDVLQSIENLVSVSVVLRATGSASGTVALLKTATGDDLNNSLTADEWNDNTAQHVTITATTAETNVAAGSYWLAVVAQTNDTPAHNITLGVGLLAIAEDGYDTGETPPDVEEDYYTQTESDARYLLRSEAGIKSRWGADGLLYIENADNAGWWHPLTIKGDPDKPYFEPAPGVELP